ncbi:deoxyribonuclease-1-like 1 [Tachyglossus aculeatus]|uniref:deoxyribonuclease-1-like 1 n=1 Tax=Tachyglossus aculeatus TaxID=9261 RepID=UPI0018F7838B|nr:deoxyribonuclease-1-like 1 [Tachyglossus aculeatus]
MHLLGPFPLLLLLLLQTGPASSSSSSSSFRICAFNIQRLTLAKVAKVSILDVLVKILARCDITVLQEVIDTSGDTIPLLLRDLNNVHKDSGPYSSLSSPQLGRSTYMEKYVFIYRSDRTKVLDSYVYQDEQPGKPDVFAREPFIAVFSLPNKVLPSLVLVPLHTAPKNAGAEINALYDVFLNVTRQKDTEDIMLLGDFNADCKFLTKKQQEELLLRTTPGFHWLIPDGVDTTVRQSTHCTYDRILVYGENCFSQVQRASPFNFPEWLGLTEAQALEISDHYPVEVELNRAGGRQWDLSPGILLLPLLLLYLSV